MSNPYEPPQDARPFEPPTYSPQQPAYDQNPYAPSPGQNSYLTPAYGPYPGWAPEHPQGTLVLILGILGFFTGVTGPIAWYLGGKALKEMRASGQHYSNEQQLVIGRILGIITTALMALYVLLIIAYIVFLVVMFGSLAAIGN